MKAAIGATALAGLVASANAAIVQRAPALKVELSGPASVSSTNDLTITAAVTNTGSTPLKVLTHKTPLKASKFNSFQVTKDGKAVNFAGVKAQFRLPADAEAFFTTIGAGETVKVDHKLGALYNFVDAGEGKYSIDAATEFFYTVDGAKAGSLSPLTPASSALEVEITGDLGAASLSNNKKRDTTLDCSADQSSFIFSSLEESIDLANVAIDYINANDADQLFKDYFGTNSPADVLDHFQPVTGIDASDSGSGTPWSCADPHDVCDGGVIAYVVPSTGEGAFCEPFFEETVAEDLCTGATTVEARNVRAGTVLHEYTHLLSGTDDLGYGVPFDQELAASDPAGALNNADNHNTFATAAYLASQC